MAFVHIAEEDGSFTIQSETSNHKFKMPSIDKGIVDKEFVTAFHHSVETFGQLIDEGKAIEYDDSLSIYGKERKLEPLRAKTIETLARTSGAVNRLEEETAAREAKLFAVPALDPSYSVLAIEDREIRDWLRAMSTSERLETLQRAKDQPDQQGRLLIAMLRSPIPMLDVEKTMAKDMWTTAKRADNPAEATAIDNRRAAADWTRRGLNQVGALVSIATGWDRDRILRQIVASSNDLVQAGYGVFGYDKAAVAQTREHMRIDKVLRRG